MTEVGSKKVLSETVFLLVNAHWLLVGNILFESCLTISYNVVCMDVGRRWTWVQRAVELCCLSVVYLHYVQLEYIFTTSGLSLILSKINTLTPLQRICSFPCFFPCGGWWCFSAPCFRLYFEKKKEWCKWSYASWVKARGLFSMLLLLVCSLVLVYFEPAERAGPQLRAHKWKAEQSPTSRLIIGKKA